MADHEGRLHYRPRRIGAEVLPYDDVDVDALIAELIGADPADPMLRTYGGTTEKPAFLWIPKFRTHQSPCRRERAKPSAIPACPDDDEASPEAPSPAIDRAHEQPEPDAGSSWDRPGPADVLNTDVLNAESGCALGAGAPAAEAAQQSSENGIPGETIVARWNQVATECGLVACKALGKKRRAALGERWRNTFWRDHYEEALERLRHIRWVRGETGQRWRANLDWFLRPDTVTKLVEGGYDDNVQSVGAGRTGGGSPF